MIRNKWGRQIRNYELALKAFGVKYGHHLPDEHIETTVDDHKVVLLSKDEVNLKRKNPPKTNRSVRHRMMVECPFCQRLIPAGRQQQHEPTHKEFKRVTIWYD